MAQVIQQAVRQTNQQRLMAQVIQQAVRQIHQQLIAQVI